MVVFDNHEFLTAEEKRLKEDRHRTKYWKKWGSYLAERQWATGLSATAVASSGRGCCADEPGDELRDRSQQANVVILQCERITVPTAMLGAVSNAQLSYRPLRSSTSTALEWNLGFPQTSSRVLGHSSRSRRNSSKTDKTLLLRPDFPHDHARSRAYRWGEDGIAGVCDTHGLQNIAFAFWNGKECVSNLSAISQFCSR